LKIVGSEAGKTEVTSGRVLRAAIAVFFERMVLPSIPFLEALTFTLHRDAAFNIRVLRVERLSLVSSASRSAVIRLWMPVRRTYSGSIAKQVLVIETSRREVKTVEAVQERDDLNFDFSPLVCLILIGLRTAGAPRLSHNFIE
jgi:hypothetical protein